MLEGSLKAEFFNGELKDLTDKMTSELRPEEREETAEGKKVPAERTAVVKQCPVPGGGRCLMWSGCHAKTDEESSEDGTCVRRSTAMGPARGRGDFRQADGGEAVKGGNSGSIFDLLDVKGGEKEGQR